MSGHAKIKGMVLAGMLMSAAASGAPPVGGTGGGGGGRGDLQRELERVRRALREARAEVRDMRAFLERTDPEADIARWDRRAAAFAEQRRVLEEQRLEIERARRSVRAEEAPAAAGTAAAKAPEQPDMPPPVGAPGSAFGAGAGTPPPRPTTGTDGRPRWELRDYQIAAIPLDDQPPEFIESPADQRLAVREGSVDRDDVLVRGTLVNRSAGTWRYTFQVHVGDRSGKLIGRWRYRTPPLRPGEWHEFEVKVPVVALGSVYSYQIGNIEAERPANE